MWAAAALVFATAAVYAPLRQHGFVNFDDPQYVSENAAVTAGVTGPGLWWALAATHAGNWHPLTWLSHMIDVELFGLDAGGHHLTSAVLHALNGLLLFAVLRQMTGAVARSAFVAALFAVHPLHVESVAWIAERKDVLSGLFFFLTLGAWAIHARRPNAGRYALVVLLFAGGLMAKPMLVTLPVVLLLLDYWPLARLSSAAQRRRAVLEKLPLVALAAASAVVTLAAQRGAGAVKPLDLLPLDRRLANAVVSYVVYIFQAFWPVRLAAIYPYPAAIPAWTVLGAAAVLVAVSVLAIRASHRHPYVAVGWFWYLVMLAPVIGLVQVGSQPRADRYTYLPLVGLFIAVSWGIPAWLDRRRRRGLALAMTAAVVIVAAATVAAAQVRHWKDSVALWEHAVAVTAPNHRAETNLAHALAKQRRFDEAIVHFSEAVRVKPDFAEARNNLGFVLAEKGSLDEAVAQYREALRARPDYAEAHNNLGVALASQGRNGEAIGHLQAALRLAPGLAESHNNLGAALAGDGRLDEAVRHFSEAMRLRPNYAEARRNLALAQEELDHLAKAGPP